MSGSLNSSASSTDDLSLGYSVIGYAIDALAAGVAIAVAWSCSTVLMGLIMLIVMGLLMYLLSLAAFMLLSFKLSTASVAKLGHSVGGLSARVTSLFSRKTPVVAA